jgi:hypothetical protein
LLIVSDQSNSSTPPSYCSQKIIAQTCPGPPSPCRIFHHLYPNAAFFQVKFKVDSLINNHTHHRAPIPSPYFIVRWQTDCQDYPNSHPHQGQHLLEISQTQHTVGYFISNPILSHHQFRLVVRYRFHLLPNIRRRLDYHHLKITQILYTVVYLIPKPILSPHILMNGLLLALIKQFRLLSYLTESRFRFHKHSPIFPLILLQTSIKRFIMVFHFLRETMILLLRDCQMEEPMISRSCLVT